MLRAARERARGAAKLALALVCVALGRAGRAIAGNGLLVNDPEGYAREPRDVTFAAANVGPGVNRWWIGAEVMIHNAAENKFVWMTGGTRESRQRRIGIRRRETLLGARRDSRWWTSAKVSSRFITPLTTVFCA